MAAGLYHKMKKAKANVELVNEYVKSWAYMKRPIKSFDQVYIFGKQLNAEDRLLFHSEVDYIISDSPILIQYCYATLNDDPVREPLLEIIRQFDRKFRPYNVFLDTPSSECNPIGRYHDLAAANKAAEIMKDVLTREYGTFITWDPNDPDRLSEFIMNSLGL